MLVACATDEGAADVFGPLLDRSTQLRVRFIHESKQAMLILRHDG
jgi:hypothetical protein